MTSITSQAMLQLLLLGITLCTALDPKTLQVDLVFPRANATYKPIYPFPVVFAIHNAAAAWDYAPYFAWQLITNDYGGIYDIVDHGGFSPIMADQQAPRGPPPPSPFLLINGTDGIKTYDNNTSTRRTNGNIVYSLIYWLTLTAQNCSSIEDEETSGNQRASSFNGQIPFQTNPNGETPNITAGGPCTQPLGAVGIAGQDSTGSNPVCPKLQKQPPVPEQCAFKIDSQVARQVASAMIQESRCNVTTWPDPTGLVSQCIPKPTSGARREYPTSRELISLLLGSLFIWITLF